MNEKKQRHYLSTLLGKIQRIVTAAQESLQEEQDVDTQTIIEKIDEALVEAKIGLLNKNG